MPTEDGESTDRDPDRSTPTDWQLRADGGPATEGRARGNGATGFARATVETIREEDVPFKAAGVAYYAVASFLPLVIVAVAATSIVGGEDQLLDAIRGSVSGSAVDVIENAFEQSRGRSGAGLVGLLVAVWGATRIFRGISTAFDELYREAIEDSFLTQLWKAVLVLAALAVAFAVVAAAGAAITLVPFDVPLPGLVWNLLALAGLVLGLLPLYYVLPPVDVTVGEVLPGAVVAAIGWVLLQYGFSIYARNAGTYAAYGFLGAILLFVVFLYFAGFVLLVGAVVNVVRHERSRETAA